MATVLLKTAAEDALQARFSAERASLPGAEEFRAAAFAAYAVEGLPHRRVEDWKWTDLRANLVTIPPMAEPADKRAIKAAKELPTLFSGIETRRLVILNGRFEPKLSDLKLLEKGLVIRSLSRLLNEGDSSVLASGDEAADNTLVKLNIAFATDGVSIDLPSDKELSRPIEIAHITTGPAASVTVCHEIWAREGSKASIFMSFQATDPAAHVVNAKTRVWVAEGAELDLVTIQDEPTPAFSFTTWDVTLGKRAKLNTFHAALGAGLARNQIFGIFEGQGAEAHFRGVSLLNGTRHADTTLMITHNAEGCISREVFKAAVNDSGRSVFQGKIKVPAHAQKTDARMMNNSLLLSDEAEVNSKPELEIFADDVQCGHGATCGELNDTQLFYLMARGIPKAEAQAMLVLAFLAEAVDDVPNESVRELLVARFADWLDQGAAS